jgi:hypothetical protein
MMILVNNWYHALLHEASIGVRGRRVKRIVPILRPFSGMIK